MGVRERFISKVLTEEGDRMLELQNARIAGSRLKSRTGRLLNDRHIDVTEGTEQNGKLTFTHPGYERYLDLRRIRYGSKTVSHRRRIHNRYTFGTYSSIARRLMYEFTELTAEMIRKQMDSESK